TQRQPRRAVQRQLMKSATGYVDWKKTRKYEVGDIVYIYRSSPYSRIEYKTVVKEIRSNSETDIYWKKTIPIEAVKGLYVRLVLISTTNCNKVSFDQLKKRGILSYAPQGPCRLSSKAIVYLEECFGEIKNEE
ncbi:MAG: hypothetical protein LUI14_06260, partial [Lachnospiraceae bacterium]|nr:hypothetical protein [Lachnospiraceae bacterium]